MAGCTSPQHACVQGIGFVCFISFFFFNRKMRSRLKRDILKGNYSSLVSLLL